MANRQFTPKIETALAAKLRPLTSTFRKDYLNLKTPSLPSVMGWKKEGEDHINIWHRSSTTLGEALSQYSSLDIEHPVLRHFSSVESFWQWLLSRDHDDRLRQLIGNELRQLGKSLPQRRIPNIQAIIMDANWLKVMRHHELRKALVNSTLPFDCYYFEKKNPKLRIRPYYANWMVYGFEEIRRALKEKREPDFEILREVGKEGEDFYKPLMDALYANIPQDVVKPAVVEQCLLTKTGEIYDVENDKELQAELVANDAQSISEDIVESEMEGDLPVVVSVVTEESHLPA